MANSSGSPQKSIQPNVLQSWKANVARECTMAYPVIASANYTEDAGAGIGTFCINPLTLDIKYNPAFAASNDVQTNTFCLIHEAWHFIGDHLTRRDKRKTMEGALFDFDLWMWAEEESTNEVVSALTGWPIPAGIVPADPVRQGMTVEQRYEHLKLNDKRKKITICINCMDKSLSSKDGDSKGDQMQKTAMEMLKSQLGDAVAKQVQEMLKDGKLQPGNMPGELKEIANRFSKLNCPPKWDQLLGRFMRAMDLNCKHFDHGTILQRRVAMDGLCVPNLSSSPKIKKGIISIDNSGSVSDAMFAKLTGTVESLARQLGFNEFIVQHFTTQVMKTQRVTTLKGIQNISRQADGGTALDDCNSKARNHNGQFHIILTDGYVAWLDSYSMPTIIIRTVKDTSEPPVVPNLIGSIIVDAEEDFGE